MLLRKVKALLRCIGRKGLYYLSMLGQSVFFLINSLLGKSSLVKQIPLIIEQIYLLGFRSLWIVGISALFIGMVLALQGYTVLVRFGAEAALGQLVSLSLLKELGPVMVGLLFVGRACSSVVAEIGLLKATEQWASLEMLGVDPFKKIIAPRFWGGVFSLPILNAAFITISISGAYWIAVQLLGVDRGAFWGNMQLVVDARSDVIVSMIKSFVFGVTSMWISLFRGFKAGNTAEEIAAATTSTVVGASLAILGLDVCMTIFWFGV